MILDLLPALLLIGVAFHHAWRVWRLDQSPWKGGGFGMFSSTSERVPAVYLMTAGVDDSQSIIRAVGLPERARLTAHYVPTRRNMMALAREVLAMRWQRCGAVAHPLRSRATAIPVKAVIVRDRRIDFDRATVTHTGRDLIVYTLRADHRTST